MLLVRGDTRVADIYMTEFDRIFRHFYFRNIANELAGAKTSDDAKAIFLDETDAWTESYFKPGTLKNNRRLMFFDSATTTWFANAAKGGEQSGEQADAPVKPAKPKTRKKKTAKKKTAKKKATKAASKKKIAKKSKKKAGKKKTTKKKTARATKKKAAKKVKTKKVAKKTKKKAAKKQSRR
jgi:hypothetical protein